MEDELLTLADYVNLLMAEPRCIGDYDLVIQVDNKTFYILVNYIQTNNCVIKQDFETFVQQKGESYIVRYDHKLKKIL